MSKRGKRDRRSTRGRVARRRRRLVRLVSALVGSAMAATGGWLYAGSRPAAERPAGTVAPAHGSIQVSLGPPELPDPVVRGGALEMPILDWTEVLPTCH